jgi:hypothetical protein
VALGASYAMGGIGGRGRCTGEHGTAHPPLATPRLLPSARGGCTTRGELGRCLWCLLGCGLVYNAALTKPYLVAFLSMGLQSPRGLCGGLLRLGYVVVDGWPKCCHIASHAFRYIPGGY